MRNIKEQVSKLTRVCDITEYLTSLYPPELAEDFDNVGLLAGDSIHSVKKVFVTLDADAGQIAEAIRLNADMIVTHHPLLFSPLKRVTDENIISLIKNNISVFSAHTNLDSAPGGVNDSLAKLVGLTDTQRVTMPDCKLTGVVGKAKETNLKDFIDKVKKALGAENVRYTGDLNDVVSKVGVIGGSAAEFFDAMKDCGCDTFLTADLKYHQAQSACAAGINIIDAGHFETENRICSVLGEVLKKRFPDIEVFVSERKTSYIKYG